MDTCHRHTETIHTFIRRKNEATSSCHDVIQQWSSRSITPEYNIDTPISARIELSSRGTNYDVIKTITIHITRSSNSLPKEAHTRLTVQHEAIQTGLYIFDDRGSTVSPTKDH